MGELPLDDPRWWPMKAAIELRQRQTGAVSLAVTDLELPMAGGRLRSMRRNLTSNERERLSASFWKGHVIDFSLGFVQYYRRTVIDSTPKRWGVLAHQPADRLDGWLFYVWKPDFDKLYARPQRKTKSKRKPGSKNKRGRRPEIKPEQQKWLQEKYDLDVKANPLLVRHKQAIPHVQGLAKTKFGIDVGSTTLLEQIIRPVLRSPRS